MESDNFNKGVKRSISSNRPHIDFQKMYDSRSELKAILH